MSSNNTDRNAASGLLGMDRRAMEEARLARTRKRERPVSPPTVSRKAPRLDGPSNPRIDVDLTAAHNFSSTVQQDQQSRKSAGANAAVERMKAPLSISKAGHTDNGQAKSESLPQGSIKYPRGVVKKTWAFGHERTGNEVKIEEVLEPLSVRTAVLSAFQWDLDWVLSKLKTPLTGGSTKCIFVMQAKGDQERAKIRQEAKESGMASFMRLCLPPMDGLVWCMHSKLMLLFHPNKLRVATPTANLLNFDWGETGQMENSVFMIDLPRLPDNARTSDEDLTSFGKELRWFLDKQRLDQDVRDGILNFDFSATERIAFVHTAGGVHYRQNAERTGLLGLSRTVQTFNLATNPETLEIDFAASSIGQLNDKYLQDLYSAVSGTNFPACTAAAAKPKQSTKKSQKQLSSNSLPTINPLHSKLRIYFPTSQTVRSSTAGAAGSLCLQRSYFEAKTFPRTCFRDHISTRAGLLSHNKILCARGKACNTTAATATITAGETAARDIAWIYIGSANMSKSAWGELPADRTSSERKITCRNWECGVLIPVDLPAEEAEAEVEATEGKKKGRKKKRRGRGPREDDEEDSETQSESEREAETDSETEAEADLVITKSGSPHQKEALVGMSVFDSVLELPFRVPGDEYAGREPWYFKEQE